MKYDHILIVGFCASERPEDIRPFLKEVTGGRDIPEQRIQAVADQYLEIGGSSPYHDNVQQIKINLHEALSANQIDLPVYIG